MYIKTTLLLSLLLSFFYKGTAQTVINSASGQVSIHGITFEFSVGEMSFVTTENNANLIITQGFLQPQEINNASPLPTPLTDFVTNLKVYPNPTSNWVTIESEIAWSENFKLRVMDASGKTILNRYTAVANSNHNCQLDFTALTPGTYFILIQDNQNVASFKILKTK